MGVTGFDTMIRT